MRVITDQPQLALFAIVVYSRCAGGVRICLDVWCYSFGINIGLYIKKNKGIFLKKYKNERLYLVDRNPRPRPRSSLSVGWPSRSGDHGLYQPPARAHRS
jgi:hypothetical protein